MHHFHSLQKHALPQKAFGVFQQQVFRHESPIAAGLSPQIPCPVSRHTEIRRDDVLNIADLHVVATAGESGLCLLEEEHARAFYMFNHLEYGTGTLAREYRRDLLQGLGRRVPENLFPEDGPEQLPANSWRQSGRRFFSN